MNSLSFTSYCTPALSIVHAWMACTLSPGPTKTCSLASSRPCGRRIRTMRRRVSSAWPGPVTVSDTSSSSTTAFVSGGYFPAAFVAAWCSQSGALGDEPKSGAEQASAITAVNAILILRNTGHLLQQYLFVVAFFHFVEEAVSY